MSTPLCTAIVANGELIHGSWEARPVAWWSFTKAVLAAATLALVRDGRLSLDESLPGKPYSIRQLLNHTAGVPNYSELAAYGSAVESGDTPWSVSEMLDRVQADRLVFPPGAGWRYSNTGYALLRQVIETTVGASLQQALQECVLGPLGVEEGVVVAKEVSDLDGTEWGNPLRYDPKWVYHGLLIGPPAAAALLLDRLLMGSFLPDGLLAAMKQKYPLGETLPGRPARHFGYGLGLMMTDDGPAGPSVGHSGGGPLSTSAIYRFPDYQRTVACFAPLTDVAAVEWAANEIAISGEAGTRIEHRNA